jgi:Transposase IS4
MSNIEETGEPTNGPDSDLPSVDSDDTYTESSSDAASDTSDEAPPCPDDVVDEDVEDTKEEPPAPFPAPQHAPRQLDPTSWNAPRVDPGPARPMPDTTRGRNHTRLRESVVATAKEGVVAAFGLFLSNELLGSVAAKTSATILDTSGGPVSLSEMLEWIALLITMGIHWLPTTEMYWQKKNFGTVKIRSLADFCDFGCVCRVFGTQLCVCNE